MGVQVNGLYRNEDGSPRSILKRQFISFSYDERDIEEFGLIATFSGSGLDKEVYAPFQDITTEQEELNGQLFWRSKFNANKVSFTLATDGMTVRQLEDFKFHFRPGFNKELILSEHHNRAILARVASAPKMKLTPFEHREEINISGTKYPVITTLYKGEISLDFVMDDPHWYSKVSYVDEINEENLKLIYEDSIPYYASLENCFLANNEIKKTDTIPTQLYYCGTAPANPVISFDLTLTKDSSELLLLARENTNEYPYLKIGNKTIHFDLPSIFTSYNYALNTINLYGENSSVLEIRKAIQSITYDYYTRAYAMKVIDELAQESQYVDIHSGQITSAFIDQFKINFSEFFNTANPLRCKINNQNGVVSISCKIANSTEEITEKAGNMIKSNYLIIEPTNSNYQEISSNVTLENLQIDYKYMYL